MTNKEAYEKFCQRNNVIIYSRPWWMDAVCLPENWDVWVYWKGTQVVAAMPYYIEKRGAYMYITKAPLTQINGLQIWYPEGQRNAARQSYEEKIVEEANKFIESLHVDVYEQQFCHEFQNWLPFFWKGYSALPRYNYVIEETADINKVRDGLTKSYRNKIKNAQKRIREIAELSPEQFWHNYMRVYERQGISCSFSKELFLRVDAACRAHGCCKALGALNEENEVTSIIYLVWDEKAFYRLMGGYMVEHASDETYSALTWHAIEMAVARGLQFDFEGSVIQRINRSVREYGGEPKMYFRIRKVFNPAVIRMEAEQQIEKLHIAE